MSAIILLHPPPHPYRKHWYNHKSRGTYVAKIQTKNSTYRPANRDIIYDYFAQFTLNQRFKHSNFLPFLASNRQGFIPCLILLVLEFILN